jgi:hypothetical protein
MLGPLPQPRVLADLGASAFLEGAGSGSLQAESALHPVDRFLQDRQTFHPATRDDRFPYDLLRGGGSHPHQFAPRFGAGASPVATL